MPKLCLNVHASMYVNIYACIHDIYIHVPKTLRSIRLFGTTCQLWMLTPFAYMWRVHLGPGTHIQWEHWALMFGHRLAPGLLARSGTQRVAQAGNRNGRSPRKEFFVDYLVANQLLTSYYYYIFIFTNHHLIGGLEMICLNHTSWDDGFNLTIFLGATQPPAMHPEKENPNRTSSAWTNIGPSFAGAVGRVRFPNGMSIFLGGTVGVKGCEGIGPLFALVWPFNFQSSKAGFASGDLGTTPLWWLIDHCKP